MQRNDTSGRPLQLGNHPAFLNRLVESLRLPVYVIDVRDHTVVYANRATAQSGELKLGETTCYALTNNRNTPCSTEHACSLEEVRETGCSARAEHIHYDQDGHPNPVQVFGEPIFDDHGELAYMVEYCLDISERRGLEQDLRQAAAVFHHAREGILITDAEGRIERVNEAFSEITGSSAAEVTGYKPGQILGSGWQDADFYRRMWQTLTEHGEWKGEVWNRRKDGSVFPEWLTISRVSNDQGETTHYIGIFSDITEKKKTESRLQGLAYFDPLTNLPNRATLEDRLDRALARLNRGHDRMALLFLDMDGFKAINDRWGHEAGDGILSRAAERLQNAVRETDTVARIGGDEFVILLEGTTDCRADAVADKLLAAFVEPFPLPDGSSVQMGLSIGIVDCEVAKHEAQDPAHLIALADQAMYRAKSAGRNTYRHAEAVDRAKGRRGNDRTSARALERDELVLFYQPQVELVGNRLAGLEALLRWQHPERGLLLPGEFLAEARDEGNLLSMGEWALTRACQQQREWRDRGGSPGPVAVNLAPSQWHDSAALLQSLDRVLGQTGIAPEQLELEVPETALVKEGTANRRTLNALANMGVRLTIDEFGSGDLPLELLALPAVGKLKLASAFVERSLQAEANSEPARLLAATHAQAQSLDLEVVAKGVETRPQCQDLMERGHRDAQGFFLAEPQPADHLESAVHSGQIALSAC